MFDYKARRWERLRAQVMRRDGSVDFTDPAVHEMANPAYGVSIRPEDSFGAIADLWTAYLNAGPGGDSPWHSGP